MTTLNNDKTLEQQQQQQQQQQNESENQNENQQSGDQKTQAVEPQHESEKVSKANTKVSAFASTSTAAANPKPPQTIDTQPLKQQYDNSKDNDSDIGTGTGTSDTKSNRQNRTSTPPSLILAALPSQQQQQQQQTPANDVIYGNNHNLCRSPDNSFPEQDYAAEQQLKLSVTETNQPDSQTSPASFLPPTLPQRISQHLNDPTPTSATPMDSVQLPQPPRQSPLQLNPPHRQHPQRSPSRRVSWQEHDEVYYIEPRQQLRSCSCRCACASRQSYPYAEITLIGCLLISVAFVVLVITSIAPPPPVPIAPTTNANDNNQNNDDNSNNSVPPTISPTIDALHSLSPIVLTTLQPWLPPNFHSSPSHQNAIYWVQQTLDTVLASTTQQQTQIQRIQNRYILALLFFSLNGPAWDSDWLITPDECSWDYIRCSAHQITTLDFTNNTFHTIVGRFPFEINYLISLQHLSIPKNNISSLPDLILPDLSTFNFAFNTLQSIPSFRYGAPIKILNLSHNTDMTGNLDGLPFFDRQLQHIDISNTKIMGTIPTRISLLGPSLESLQLHNNHLSGIIPSEIGLLGQLAKLSLEGNPSLNGSIPSTLCNLSRLSDLTVSCENVGCSCVTCVCV